MYFMVGHCFKMPVFNSHYGKNYTKQIQKKKVKKKALDKRFDLLFTSFVFRQTDIPIGLVTLTPGKPDFYWSETCEPLIPWGTRLPSVLLDSKQCVKIVKKTWRWSMGRCRHAKSFICEYNSGKETLSPT